MSQVNLRRLPIIKEEILKDFFGTDKNLALDYSCPLARKPSMIQRTNLYRLSLDFSSSAVPQTIFDELLKVGYNFQFYGAPFSGCFEK